MRLRPVWPPEDTKGAACYSLDPCARTAESMMINRGRLGAVVSASAFLLTGTAHAVNVDGFRAVDAAELRKAAKDTFDGYLRNLHDRLNVNYCDTLISSHPGSVETI